MSRISPREIIERSRLTPGAEDSTGQLWITDRILRLAEYQDIVERVNDQVSELRDIEAVNPHDPRREPLQHRSWQPPEPKRIPAMLLKMKIEALRTAAEELGQLPNDLPQASERSVYAVIGIPPEELKKLK